MRTFLLFFFSFGFTQGALSQAPIKVEVVVPGEGTVTDLRARYGDSPMVSELTAAYSEAAKVGYADSFNTSRDKDKEPLTHLAPALSHYINAINAADLESESAAALSASVGERGGTWISWAIREKRLGELLDTVNAAMKRVPPRKASWGATCLVRELLVGLINYAPTEAMLPLIETLQQRHPHMLFHKTRDWMPLVEWLANQGWLDDARSLAQSILIAPEPNPSVLKAIGREGFSRSGIWEQHRDGQIKPLLHVALSSDEAAFVSRLDGEVKKRPDDRELMATWLGALALTGKLVPEALEPASKWTAMERFEVAQIVARLEPITEAAQVLRPWLIEGLKAVFQAHNSLDRSLPLEFIKASGGVDEFRAIFGDAIASRQNLPGKFDTPALWHALASIIVALGTEDQHERFLDAFLGECQRCIQPSINGYAGDHQHYLAELVPSLPAKLKPKAASACADLFRLIAADDRKRGGDPNPWNVRETLFALIAAGDHDAMEELATELEAPAIEEQKRHGTDTPLFIEEMKALSRFVARKPNASPRAVVWFRQDEKKADSIEVVWEWVLDPASPKGMPQERLEQWGLAIPRPGFGGPTARLGLRSKLLRERDGDFDLIVNAGAARDTMVEVMRVQGARAAGATSIKTKLPECGWVVSKLVSRTTGEVFEGDAVMYSLLPPLAKSGVEPEGGTGQPTVATLMAEVKVGGLVLDAGFHAKFGRPVTGIIPIDPKRRYLLTAWTSWDNNASGYFSRAPNLQFLHFNYLDENKKPLRDCHDSSLTPLCRDCYSRNLVARFTQDVIDPIHRFQGEEGGGDGDKIRYLVITAFQGDWTVAPLFQLRPIELEE